MKQIDVQYGKIKRVIGDNSPTFLIAELSANHDRDLNQALALIDMAAQAGFDAVSLPVGGVSPLRAEPFFVPDNGQQFHPMWSVLRKAWASGC